MDSTKLAASLSVASLMRDCQDFSVGFWSLMGRIVAGWVRFAPARGVCQIGTLEMGSFGNLAQVRQGGGKT